MAAHVELFVHLVWATWRRLPIISQQLEPHLFAAIFDKCRDLRCVPMAIGGMPDHVHVLVSLSPSVSVAALVKQAKGTSSHLANHGVATGTKFRWQVGYSAFSLRKSEVPVVQDYIRRQKEHHSGGDSGVVRAWELAAAD